MPTPTPLSGVLNGPAPVQPITGFMDPTPFASAEDRMGNPVDPRHQTVGEQAQPYPWEGVAQGPHGPFGPENQLLGDTSQYTLTLPAGYLAEDPTGDYQPATRAAAWPRGLPTTVDPDDVARTLIESRAIHSSGMNSGAREYYQPTLEPVNDNWYLIDNVTQGSSQQQTVPSQVGTSVGGWGSSDRVQAQARQNGYGYDSAHVLRRYAQGSIPGNYLWMQPQSRALPVTIPHTGVPPVGAFSPFTGQDTRTSFNTQGAVLTTVPSEYTAPPDPALMPAPSGDASPPVSGGWALT